MQSAIRSKVEVRAVPKLPQSEWLRTFMPSASEIFLEVAPLRLNWVKTFINVMRDPGPPPRQTAVRLDSLASSLGKMMVRPSLSAAAAFDAILWSGRSAELARMMDRWCGSLPPEVSAGATNTFWSWSKTAESLPKRSASAVSAAVKPMSGWPEVRGSAVGEGELGGVRDGVTVERGVTTSFHVVADDTLVEAGAGTGAWAGAVVGRGAKVGVMEVAGAVAGPEVGGADGGAGAGALSGGESAWAAPAAWEAAISDSISSARASGWMGVDG